MVSHFPLQFTILQMMFSCYNSFSGISSIVVDKTLNPLSLMKIAVTDACIFIDLIELDLVQPFFQLRVELHTTIDVINELFP